MWGSSLVTGRFPSVVNLACERRFDLGQSIAVFLLLQGDRDPGTAGSWALPGSGFASARLGTVRIDLSWRRLGGVRVDP